MADVWFAAQSLESVIAQATAKIDLSSDAAANTTDVRAANVLQTNQKLMVITAGTNDVVRLDHTGWTQTATTASLDHHTYALWSHAGAHVLIDQHATVHAVL